MKYRECRIFVPDFIPLFLSDIINGTITSSVESEGHDSEA